MASLRESILNQVNLFSKEKNQDTRWKQIKAFITGCEDRLLFFVDNITQEDPDLTWLTSLKAHVVITSRLLKVHSFEKYEIDFLSKEQSIEVFYCYYDYDKNSKEKETVSQLVDLVSCHTLSIELLAGIANQPKYRFKLKQFLQDLWDNGFGFPNLTTYTSHTYEDLKISEHLGKLFKIADLSDEQLRILGNFRIIPRGVQVPCEFSEWIGSEDNALSKLEKSRWISLSENGYVMYDIVWEAVKLQLTNIPYEYAEKMIKTIISGGYFNYKDEHTVSAQKIKIAEAYSKYFSVRKTEEWGVFLNLFGIRYYNLEKYKEALVCQKKVLGIREKVLGKDHPDIARTYNNFALIHIRTGEYDKAREYNEKALEIREKVLGKKHSDTAITYNNIARVHHFTGAYDKALWYFQEALDIKEAVLGKNNSSTAATYNNMGRVYHSIGAYDKAHEYFQKALEIKEIVFGKDHPSTEITYNTMASMYQDKGEYDNALKYYEKTLSIRERVLGKDHSSTATIYNNLAGVYQNIGEYEKAREYYEKALGIFETVLGKDHSSYKTIQNNLDTFPLR